MTIPTITYPTAIDSNQNLYQVRDGLRVQLAEDYNPGDTSITIVGDLTNFDSTGIITLTEQCSEAELRAISFYYGSRTSTTFDQLELLSGFIDSAKPKNLTNVTQNVMALHHNNLKDAIIQIENFAGKSTDSPIGPLEGTMHQRINYLRSIALAPKAWFSADQTIGLAPLKVTFEDQSFQLGTDGTSQTVTRIWDFGDNTGPSIITIDETTEVPSNITNVLVNEVGTGNTITKTYTKPGIYSVSLTVTNDFGTDEVIFDDYIQARFPAPDYAAIEFVLGPNQVITAGSPSGGPYPPPFATPPKIRSVANQIINIQLGPAGYVNSGINPNTGRTYAGEEVDMTNTPIDPIESYTWIINDDTAHNNSYSARAVFSVG